MKSDILLIFTLSILTLTSCDWQSDVAVVSNKRTDTISVIPWKDKELGPISDSMIYNDRLYMPDQINPGESKTITLPDRHFGNAPDSEKLDLYIFDLDSINVYRSKKEKLFMLKKCLLKKIKIPVKQLADKIDTFQVK